MSEQLELYKVESAGANGNDTSWWESHESLSDYFGASLSDATVTKYVVNIVSETVIEFEEDKDDGMGEPEDLLEDDE